MDGAAAATASQEADTGVSTQAEAGGDTADSAETSNDSLGSSLVPMGDAAYDLGTIRNVAGYSTAGTAGLVGDTYNVNLWGMFSTSESQGISAFANALQSEASDAGATNLSITGNNIINSDIANLNPALPARFGFSFTQVNPTTIILRGPVP